MVEGLSGTHGTRSDSESPSSSFAVTLVMPVLGVEVRPGVYKLDLDMEG